MWYKKTLVSERNTHTAREIQRKKNHICCHKTAKNNIKYTFLAKIVAIQTREKTQRKLNQEQKMAKSKICLRGWRRQNWCHIAIFFSSFFFLCFLICSMNFYPKIFCSVKIKIPPWIFSVRRCLLRCFFFVLLIYFKCCCYFDYVRARISHFLRFLSLCSALVVFGASKTQLKSEHFSRLWIQTKQTQIIQQIAGFAALTTARCVCVYLALIRFLYCTRFAFQLRHYYCQ